ncbi:MAG TPA: rhodanese-like domain-containing protein [Chitinophagaceae bacterium]
MQKYITKQEVQQLQNENRVVRLIDIRTVAEHEKQHIPGAVNIPADQLPEKLDVLKKDDMIVCICNYGKERSQQAAELLQNAGFENTFYLEGGTAGWCDEDKA